MNLTVAGWDHMPAFLAQGRLGVQGQPRLPKTLSLIHTNRSDLGITTLESTFSSFLCVYLQSDVSNTLGLS